MKVNDAVLNVLSNARLEGSALYLEGQLERSLYLPTDKVLQAAGGKWHRSQRAHLFQTDAAARVDQIILTGDVVVPKDEFEFFPTPYLVACRVIALADIRDGMFVLEPSAGDGALAILAQRAALNVAVDMFELMPANHAALLALNLPLSGVGPVGDFLSVAPTTIYDRVVMNPPFSRQADIKHVVHALKFLKGGGTLVSVMAAGVTFRDNRLTTEFRALVEAHGGCIDPLPPASFKCSGTSIATVVVTIPA